MRRFAKSVLSTAVVVSLAAMLSQTMLVQANDISQSRVMRMGSRRRAFAANDLSGTPGSQPSPLPLSEPAKSSELPPSPPSPSPSPPQPSPANNTAPPPFPPLGGGNCPDAAAALNLTNIYRNRHQAMPVTWSDSLAASSAAYAQKLANGGCNLVHSGGRDYGENLMMVQGYPKPDNSCMVAIRSWYSEVKNYNFNAARPYADNWPKGTGHFSQLVWRGTSSVGCGVGTADVPMTYGGKTYNGGCKVVVCRYKAPGNVANDMAFLKNVLRNITAAVV